MKDLDRLNPPQREAVMATEGPVLILAGAGSGKTRALTCRIAYLIGERKVAPWNIMAITFTNKAAGEMRERVNQIVSLGAEDVWVSTFHSSCCRILRRFIDRIGFDRSFTIYDTDDSRQVMKEVMRQLNIDSKQVKERALLSRISSAKNEMLTPEDMSLAADRWEDKRVAEAYRLYQERLRANNALDFDDLLCRTVELFEKEPDVLAFYQDRFRYIMVDEYQDTNAVQFRFLSLLASRYHNLCVVGDDDQSIYRFRGADIQNILGFEKVFPEARVIRLEQNYRSTQSILDAANAVIANNAGRKEKRLWTENGAGDKVRFHQFQNGFEEAEFISEEIAGRVRAREQCYTDYAILYRTNAQSRMFEEKFISAGIPYKIVGGVNFYARKEIKDLLSYLKTVDNGLDDLAVRRIINIPKRGIGAATIGRIEQFAAAEGLSFYEALGQADRIEGMGRSIGKLRGFTNLIARLRGAMEDGFSVRQLLDMVIEETGYVRELEEEGTDEANARIENIDEMRSKAGDYQESTENPSLGDFLQQVSLVADIDTVDNDSDYVLLMTFHAAKGLEFDTVYMVGMEDGLFPSYLSISQGGGDQSELEEERRLCYVGMTRARKHLILTAAAQRMVRGDVQYMRASRFVREIPREMVLLDRETSDTRSFLRAPELDMGDIMGFGGSASARGRGGMASASARSSAAIGSRRTTAQLQMKDFHVKREDHLDYRVGDMVRHVKFGLGEVLEIKDGAKDFEVTVEFDQYGRKRMFASFAKLKKV